MPNSKILAGDSFRFKANPRWKDEDVIRSVARIVQDTEEFFVQPSGYKWMLGTSNVRWMDKDPQTGEFILAWRYGYEGNAIYMQLLYHVILWRLGIEHFNEEAKAKMSKQERLEWFKRYFLAFLAEDLRGGTEFDCKVLHVLGELVEEYAQR